MTRVGNVDQVLLLLREQLQRIARERETARTSRIGRADPGAARPLERVRALAALDTLDEDEIGKALVRGLLTEAFGEEVGNDPALHTIVDQVVRILHDAPGGALLMDRAVAQLKASRA